MHFSTKVSIHMGGYGPFEYFHILQILLNELRYVYKIRDKFFHCLKKSLLCESHIAISCFEVRKKYAIFAKNNLILTASATSYFSHSTRCDDSAKIFIVLRHIVNHKSFLVKIQIFILKKLSNNKYSYKMKKTHLQYLKKVILF